MTCRLRPVVVIVLFAALGLWVSGCKAAGPSPTKRAKGSAETQETASASPALAALDPAQRQFVDAYVKAVSGEDVDALNALIAPRVLSCYDGDSRAYLYHRLRMRNGPPISRDFRAVFSRYAKRQVRSPLVTPVPATHSLKITYTKLGRTVVQVWPVATDNGKWYLAFSCPTLEWRELHKMRGQQRQRAREIYSKLQDPLLTQLRTLIKDGHSGEAVHQCAKALKIDTETAHYVVMLLRANKPQ